MTGDLVDLPALGPDGEYRTRNREIIEDTAGVPVAESSFVPRLFVQRSIDAQRKLLPLAAADREAALTRAADVFASSTIAGLDFDSYVELTCRVTGLPMTAARAGAHAVAESLTTACDAVRPARPVGATFRLAGREHVWRRCGVGTARRGTRCPRSRQRSWRARPLAAGAGAGLPGGDPSVAARAVHRPPAHPRLAAERLSCWRRAVPADRPHRRRRCHPGGRPGHGLRRPGRRRQVRHGIRGCSPTGPAGRRS